MRILSLLLTCYIVALIFVPCHDELPTNEVVTSALERQTDDQHHHMEDGCSPFCTCSCCTTPVVQLQQPISLYCEVEQVRLTIDLHKADPCSRNASIWQPPKLS